MSVPDITLFVGALVSVWSIGFVAGFLMTRFKDAMSQV